MDVILIFYVLLLSACASVAYRAGGLSKEQPYWIPIWMRQKWIRQWLCPLFCLLLALPDSWAQLGLWCASYGLIGAAIGTYFDTWFGYDNFWMAGFAVGLAALPLIGLGIPWYLIVARAFVLAILWGGWCAIFGNDHVEEHGRGAFIVLTMLILL